MNKKLMAVAVAGAFAAPAVALAQASNVQIYGTIYAEYAYAQQGALPTGDMVKADVLQAPGSEIGFKGEEALGGGLSAWFQCTSSAGNLGSLTSFNAGSVFCSRNSAIGLKGSWGNVYVGNWDMPFKQVAGTVRIVSDTGIWGAGPMLFGGSGTTNGRSAATTWSNRNNSTFFYNSPTWNGFNVAAGVSTPSVAGMLASTANTSGAKARLWSLAASYTNGPLYIMGGYENHANFQPSGATFAGNDNAWEIGATYQFGPVKGGLLYSKQKYETTPTTNADLSVWNAAIDWVIQGPHELLVGYTKANDTKGTFNPAGTAVTGGLMGNRIYNGGQGGTSASIWQFEYQYWLSKRTRLSAGYVRLTNSVNATYALGGLTAPKGGENQDAFAMSIKTTF